MGTAKSLVGHNKSVARSRLGFANAVVRDAWSLSDDIANAAMMRAAETPKSEEDFIEWETERMLWELDTVQRVCSKLTAHSGMHGTQSFSMVRPGSLIQAVS